MKTSEEGVDLIKHFEGCRSAAYRCVAGVLTIGFGHTRGVKQGMVISIEDAEALLDEDLADCEREVLAATKGISLTQGQFDALVSFVFNLGAPTLLRSTLLKKLRDGDLAGAAKEFLRWTKAGKPARDVPGLVKRRTAEMELFERPGDGKNLA